MTHHDITLRTADGEIAAIVTISSMHTDGSEALIEAAIRGIESELASDQVDR